jgi:hypothetical protein
VKSTNNYYFRNKILRLHEFILKYKDKYRFKIDSKYFKQALLAKKYTKRDLALLNLNWNDLEEFAEDAKISRKQKREHNQILNRKNITQHQYDFDIFYTNLLEHLNKTIPDAEEPISFNDFEIYMNFIQNENKLNEHFYFQSDDDYTALEEINKCKNILKDIDVYRQDIHCKIEEDLIAAGIDPNESEDDEYENEKNDESSVDIAVEKANLFKHLPEDIRSFFINYYKNKNNPNKDEITEDDEIPF